MKFINKYRNKLDYLTGTDRNQIRMQCMDELIGDENPVRVNDALVCAMAHHRTFAELPHHRRFS